MSAADVWSKVAQRQLAGAAAHAALADALEVAGEPIMAEAQRGRHLAESKAYALTCSRFARAHGSALPATPAQRPQLGDLPNARACVRAWLDWETATVAEYQRLYDDATKDDPDGAEVVLGLAADASKESDRARALLMRLDARSK